jgi:hypothetical protein
MTMRISLKNIFFIVLLLCIASACNKFKDNSSSEVVPESTKQIDGEWQLSTVTRNGTDITSAMDFSAFHLILNSDSTYTLVDRMPFIVKKDGKWSVDDPKYPFHLTFTESGSGNGVTTEIKYPVVEGKREISLTLSPGCHSNTYIYVFKKIEK